VRNKQLNKDLWYVVGIKIINIQKIIICKKVNKKFKEVIQILEKQKWLNCKRVEIILKKLIFFIVTIEWNKDVEL
jgi:hypothetical protein